MFALFGAFCLLLLQATLTPAQLITFRDGKVGVNFAGYHADAGLGGLLTGNSAHGGLSASAGTPWGSRAAAGLGGGLNGRTAGGAYAAAQANDEVGASAVLGGSVGEHGYIGSEAHAPGKVHSSSAQITPHVATAAPSAEVEQPPPVPTQSSYVQRVKPPKKYSLIAPNSDHSAAQGDINENRVKAATGAGEQQQQASPVIIVKRPRLRVKQRPRQRQRIVYVEREQPQQQQEEQQEFEVKVEAKETQPELTKQGSLRSDAKVVRTQTRSAAAAPVGKHTIAAQQQQQGAVGWSLGIPIGILQSLQQSIGGLGQPVPAQPQAGNFQG